MNPEQAKQREHLRDWLQKRLREKEKEQAGEIKLPIGFHINGIPIYAEEDDDEW